MGRRTETSAVDGPAQGTAVRMARAGSGRRYPVRLVTGFAGARTMPRTRHEAAAGRPATQTLAAGDPSLIPAPPDWRVVTSSLPRPLGVDVLAWLALAYPFLIALGYLLKPSLTDPAVLWPANAASLTAYLLVRYRYWPVVMAATMGWELLSVPVVSALTSGQPFDLRITFGLSCANILAVAVPALLARMLRVAHVADFLLPIASPLWIIVFVFGSWPGALLGTAIHASAAGTAFAPVAVVLWVVSTTAGIIAYAPAFAVVLGLVKEPASAPARGLEPFGVVALIIAIFGWRGLAPWQDLAEVPSLMLLALPVTWIALRFSHRVTALSVAGLATLTSFVTAHGIGIHQPLDSLGDWQNRQLTAQLFMLTAFGAALIVNKMTLNQRAMLENTRRDQERIRWYHHALEATEENARYKTAAELHDGIAQVHAAQGLLFASLKDQLGAGGPTRLLEQIDLTVKEAQTHIRRLMSDLNSPDFESATLTEIIGDLVRRFEARYGFHATFSVVDEAVIPQPAVRLIFRILQELLFNSFKHSGTKQADARVWVSEGAVLVAVTDEGVGFDPDAVRPRPGIGGFGLNYIRDCVRAAGGTVDVRRGQPRGSRIVIRLPLALLNV